VERASFNLKIKSVDEAGKFVGVGAVFGNVDLGGDRILPGAFTRTLAAGKQFPLLWQHDPSHPIGTFKATETQQGLMIEGQLLLSDATGAKAYNLLKAQVIKGLSIGYDTIKDQMVGDVRELVELRLWECSVVTFPMNESARVTGIKAMSDSDRTAHLKKIDGHRKAIDRHQRGIRESLKSLSDAFDDDPDDLALTLDEGDDEDETKALVIELRKLATQASDLHQ
jgi:uncharacterized protein